jgi:hypothetical protein
MNHEEITKAKEVLRAAGYHVDTLWHVQDITDRYECDADKAYEILTEVLDVSVEMVFDSIHGQAMFNEIKEKEQ